MRSTRYRKWKVQFRPPDPLTSPLQSVGVNQNRMQVQFVKITQLTQRTQLSGMASTLHMSTAISPEQRQPSTLFLALLGPISMG